MILLTEEEIKVALDSQFGTDRERFGFVAKAQLKKVVEWLKDYNFGETKIADDAVNSAPYFILPPREWQALLDEVKEG